MPKKSLHDFSVWFCSHLPLTNQKLRFHSVSCMKLMKHDSTTSFSHFISFVSISLSGFHIAVATFGRLAVIVCDRKDRKFCLKMPFIHFYGIKWKKNLHWKEIQRTQWKRLIFFFLFSCSVCMFMYFRLKDWNQHGKNVKIIIVFVKWKSQRTLILLYFVGSLVWLCPFNWVFEFYIVQWIFWILFYNKKIRCTNRSLSDSERLKTKQKHSNRMNFEAWTVVAVQSHCWGQLK